MYGPAQRLDGHGNARERKQRLGGLFQEFREEA